MEIVEEVERYYIRHIRSGRYYRWNFSRRDSATLVKEVIQEHWDRRLVGEDEELNRNFTNDRSIVEPSSEFK